MQCNDAFIHPCGGLIIFQMSEGQLCDFVNFATADRTQSALWPFPFRADKHARRLEPQTSMDKGIDVFRQRYERRRPPDPVRHQCVSRTANHPEWEGVVRAMSDARVRGGDIVKASKKFHREFKAEKEAYHAKNDELKRRYPS